MTEPKFTAESMVDALLDRHQLVTIVVMPGQCIGLARFPKDIPLTLNVGRGDAIQPPMFVKLDSEALEFTACFRGDYQRVTVPWGALMFAGTQDALRQLLAGAGAPAAEQPAAPAPVVSLAERRAARGR
jgi:hypothetical protein